MKHYNGKTVGGEIAPVLNGLSRILANRILPHVSRGTGVVCSTRKVKLVHTIDRQAVATLLVVISSSRL